MSIVAIIPARGGSKRIKKKNTKDFLGQPIIKYSIDAAKQSKIFDEVFVSTDDASIARVAKKYGAKVPVLRSKKASSDNATLADMMLEEISKLEQRGICPEYICLLFATAPTLSPKELIKSYNLIKKTKSDVVMPVCEFTEPIGRALQVKDGKIKMLKSANKFKRTQDLEKRYFDAGRFYFINTAKFKKNKTFFPVNCSAIVTDRMLVQDIDEMDDWHLMELKYKLYKSNGSKKFQKNI